LFKPVERRSIRLIIPVVHVVLKVAVEWGRSKGLGVANCVGRGGAGLDFVCETVDLSVEGDCIISTLVSELEFEGPLEFGLVERARVLWVLLVYGSSTGVVCS